MKNLMIFWSFVVILVIQIQAQDIQLSNKTAQFLGCYENDRKLILSSLKVFNSYSNGIEECFKTAVEKRFQYMAVSNFDTECYGGYSFYPTRFKKMCTCKKCVNFTTLICSNQYVNDYSAAVYRIRYENDPCMSLPCLNNGVCIASPDNQDYECTCGQQFSGKSCENIKNVCTKYTCQNGGICEMVRGSTDYQCICRQGFYGKNCEKTQLFIKKEATEFVGCYKTVINELFDVRKPLYSSKNVLENCFRECYLDNYMYFGVENGLAGCMCGNKNLFDSYPASNSACELCSYNPQFMCPETSLSLIVAVYNLSLAYQNPCMLQPCLYGGTCIAKGERNYECMCIPGFTGRTCDLTPCSVNRCQNAGTCFIDENNDAKCNCPYGFKGTNCEISNNDCEK